MSGRQTWSLYFRGLNKMEIKSCHMPSNCCDISDYAAIMFLHPRREDELMQAVHPAQRNSVRINKKMLFLQIF